MTLSWHAFCCINGQDVYKRQLEKNEKSQVLVRYVIQMCRTLNQMIPIAEGIETEGQINILKNLGCDFGQGYYFSKPISVKDFFNRYMEAEVKAN